jgi:5'-deoxynucleotidase YfbR-like HD superfamily hydrolase
MEAKLFRNFTGREHDLAKVFRYKIYTTMFYRTDLVIHSHRVSWIIRELNPFAIQAFGSSYDPIKTEVMGLVHDDAEIVMGDIEAGIKNKMSPDELKSVYKLEENAIGVLALKFPKKVGNYFYRQLLQESFDHTSLESQVMQFADKFDALGEALHEVYAGNKCFMTHVMNEYGLIDLPIDAYYKYFLKFFDKFPDMRPLLKTDSEWFKPLPKQDFKQTNLKGKPHTKDSIEAPTGFLPYDLWVAANLKHASQNQLLRLYTNVEG